MDVLRFESHDYRLTISTATITYTWERFERRVKDGAFCYCDYRSSRDGSLSLIDPKDLKAGVQVLNPEVNQTEWREKHPVLFETCEYQFAVEFYHIHDTADEKHCPKIRHKMKTVGENFKFYPNGEHSGILVGSIDFLNSPGKFAFAFEYRDKENRITNEWLELYVASPKLDTKNDLHQITALINQEYENYVFDYLTLTFNSFSLIRTERNNNIIWLSIFRGVVDDYFKSVRFIMSRPNNKPVRNIYHSRPERIRRWNQQEEERYRNMGKDAERHFFRYEQIENSINTRENRFVKYSLHVLGKKFREVFSEMNGLCKDMDAEEKKTLADYTKTFRQLENAAFFNKVGEFEGFRQESSILQQRSGYSQIYKAWLMLKNSLDLVDGKTNIGMKKIWELYEIWCFLVMKRLIAKVLHLDLNDSKHVREDKGKMLNTMVKSGMTHMVEFDNTKNGDVVRLEYQHTYNRRTTVFKTTTTEQRPDIVVTIHKPNGFVLTYLYDAKYRVQDDKNDCELDEGVDIDIADYPLPDAINQMHRYRDAIYYAMKDDERPRGKEIIGGYILFPGRTEGDSIENRYFFKSIKRVNIGAFPLLPADEDHKEYIVLSNLLEKHLQEILLNNSAFEQIKNSIPQKGLQYQESGKGNGVALIMMESYDDKQKYFSNGKIAVPVKLTESGMTLLENQAEIAYVLFHTRKKDENKHFFRVESIVRALSKEDAVREGYYLVQSTAKRYLCIEINLEKELDSNRFNPSKENIPYDTSTERYDSQFATLSQLMQLK